MGVRGSWEPSRVGCLAERDVSWRGTPRGEGCHVEGDASWRGMPRGGGCLAEGDASWRGMPQDWRINCRIRKLLKYCAADGEFVLLAGSDAGEDTT